MTLTLPPGSETFRLESAQSGHLLLPFSRSTQATASHHLFADDQPKLPAAACPQPGGGVGDAAESSALCAASIIEQAHLAQGKDQQVEVEEGMCANVLKNYNFDRASADVPKAFLQGVSYSELAESTQRPERDVSFELPGGEGVACLRTLPAFRAFDPRTEVLHCLKPGTGCRDAPKSFSLKFRQVTAAFGFKCSTVDPELELLFDAHGLIIRR